MPVKKDRPMPLEGDIGTLSGKITGRVRKDSAGMIRREIVFEVGRNRGVARLLFLHTPKCMEEQGCPYPWSMAWGAFFSALAYMVWYDMFKKESKTVSKTTSKKAAATKTKEA